ncbi:MAG: DUF5317 domain-containing protein [Eubacteriaceae bacterium]|nr:DUF5317 domain-containing protein [Eubacteriaceae bacterium]
MFFVIFLALGIIIGYILKGKLSNLINVNIRMIYLPIAALVFSIIANKLQWYTARHFVLYILIIVFVIVNIKESKYYIIAGLGFLSNFIVISANNLTMPVGYKIEELRLYINAYNMLINGQIPGYALASQQTKLYFLADIFYVPFLPKLGFFSLGDALLGIGGMLLIASFMKKKPEQKSEQETEQKSEQEAEQLDSE